MKKLLYLVEVEGFLKKSMILEKKSRVNHGDEWSMFHRNSRLSKSIIRACSFLGPVVDDLLVALSQGLEEVRGENSQNY